MSEATDTAKAAALIKTCRDQQGNCLYTALSFTIWLRTLRWIKIAGLVVPVVFGALAARGIVTQTNPAFAAICVFLAAVVPSAIQASNLYQSIDQYTSMAGEFTNLRDRFKYLAEVTALKSFDDFEAAYEEQRDRLERARKRPLSPPQWCFLLARKQIQKRFYEPDDKPVAQG